jgi:hypothetical protein
VDVFSETMPLPPHRDCDPGIPLKEGNKPPNIRPYIIPYKKKDEVEKIIKAMLADAKIRSSINSPYSSPAILIRKKYGSWRLCIDYRELNAQTVKDKFPIPVIEDLLDELWGAKVFTKLDLRSGYHQIRMKEANIHKTFFRTYFGHFEFVVMPFGLTNAPSTFQALMNNIFAAHLRKFVIVFFDDIPIYSKTMVDHCSHLSQVLKILRGNCLSAKMSKCVFATDRVEYLGHIITKQGVATDPSKVEAIQNWNIPKTATQLRSFLGLTGYYRRFIHNYGVICRPLHALLKKDAFNWGPEHTVAFSALKSKMSNAPILALPNFSMPFTTGN